MGSKKYKAYMADYVTYHRTEGNKLTHMLGVPMIVMAILGLLSLIHVSVAVALWVAVNLFYISLHPLLGLSMVATTGALFIAGTLVSPWVNVALFVVGWILQFVGHLVYEKKKPAFFKNFLHLLTGPLFVQKLLLRIRD